MDTKSGPAVRVVVDEEGRPYCPQGCGHLMTETATGQFMCPDWVAIETAMREGLKELAESWRRSLDRVAAALGAAPDPAEQPSLIDCAEAGQPGPFIPLGALRLPSADDA
jgi:hypothetical protein